MLFRRFIRRWASGWTSLAATPVVVALVLILATGAGRAAPEPEIPPVPPGSTATGHQSTAALPRVLSQKDETLYREIFALQEKGKWKAADKRIKQLKDRRLMGHVLAQRYLHPTAYRSRYKELRNWMAKYADHPDARRIYKLALKRRPKNYRRPVPPRTSKPRNAAPVAMAKTRAEPVYRSTKRLSREGRRQAARLKRQIRRNVLRTRLTITEELLNSRKARRLLDTVEIDEARTEVAAAWYYYGRNDKAYRLAAAAAARSGTYVPIAHWTAGLAAWRLGRIEDAAKHFENLARSDRVSSWNAAAGAYWAARAHLRLRHPERMSPWLTRAAEYPRTFYGLLARSALGLETRFDVHRHTLDPALLARLMQEPASARALALLQVGQRRRAERELRSLGAWADPELAGALLALAEQAQMAELAYRVGNRLAALESPDAIGPALDAALYPIPPWHPRGGFIVDRALVYALIRQESGFNPTAMSPDGARGLMQLMPSTASFIARDRGFRRAKKRKLFDPGTNLALGQRYLTHLMNNSDVRGDLFRLAAAYNGGPGNLRKWQRKMDYDDDPLLFIESLPSRETRLFIERVLTNLWIYRLRLGQPTPSLDTLAAGDWPAYVPLDANTPELASYDAH
ncbi:MAG: lytic transglycosylase domain-containing protein [Alphaproteobacteria bacterium]|nr:MAG: lytic transglycosylase domain-containing protein [Alphaproteobacteria bacterium]